MKICTDVPDIKYYDVQYPNISTPLTGGITSCIITTDYHSAAIGNQANFNIDSNTHPKFSFLIMALLGTIAPQAKVMFYRIVKIIKFHHLIQFAVSTASPNS